MIVVSYKRVEGGVTHYILCVPFRYKRVEGGGNPLYSVCNC